MGRALFPVRTNWSYCLYCLGQQLGCARQARVGGCCHLVVWLWPRLDLSWSSLNGPYPSGKSVHQAQIGWEKHGHLFCQKKSKKNPPFPCVRAHPPPSSHREPLCSTGEKFLVPGPKGTVSAKQLRPDLLSEHPHCLFPSAEDWGGGPL